MSDPELKPCPFCGCDFLSLNRTDYGTFWVNCPDCLACTGGVLLDDKTSRAEAIAAWNRRSLSDIQ
ncbi:Lar family restriction alleviation protein [Stenotrophomonas sp. CW117]|uniref:Lar family restriction alleviation protein n=1 Tax=Stenotrophomonas acidaminiphila TaxID=128780 RepID=UPI001784214B|nr:Lar family restriction alleviation protein [Stenotrophomonas sp. CW117]